MEQLPIILLLLYALYEGLLHAFEPDHILAVTNIVSQRNRIFPAVRDGIFWGLGHTSTIFFVGVLMILFKMNIPERSFTWFEAAVGLMLILVAVYRFRLFLRNETGFRSRSRKDADGSRLHRASYGIGIVHGLAGSGALVVLVMTQIRSVTDSLLYLLTFGIGSIAGMMLVAGLFSIPFAKNQTRPTFLLRTILIVLSSVGCSAYGCYVIYENLFA
jgi:hypothetical protein